MKAISIYTITRNQNTDQLSRLERQLSGRASFLKVREWELESMKSLVRHLEEHMQEVYALRFFYSFQIPKLGKEFDLLQIKDDQIVNIELKSGTVSDEAICKQLLQNRYYLSVLGRPVQSYTYISSQDRLVRLTSHDHIAEGDWKTLAKALQKKSCDYTGEIEKLFQAELFLFSPLTEPERFLQKEYFLTSQQRDIERQILKAIHEKTTGHYWFTGLPGTGKTLLLYDIAMRLSLRHRVCMIHCGDAGQKWRQLHDRLQRIDFLSDTQLENESQLEKYRAILVDETHFLSEEKVKIILNAAVQQPVIFSSDSEDTISSDEVERNAVTLLESMEDIRKFHLTNRIRTNAELSSFIQHMMHLPEQKVQRHYPHIQIAYANNNVEAENLLKDYIRQGYQYKPLHDTERLAVLTDEKYYYDEKGYLRYIYSENCEKKYIRELFHQLNQAKNSIALVIKENEEVYAKLLAVLQARGDMKGEKYGSF